MSRWPVFRNNSAGALALILAMGGMCVRAQAPGPAQHKLYSRAQLRRMTKDARTVEQIRVLAELYRAEEQLARARAQAQNEELERATRNRGGFSTKYPSRAATARALRDSYNNQADALAKTAAKFESQLPLPPGGSQPAVAEVPGDPKPILDRIAQLEKELKDIRKMLDK